jgi:hypothetical protein
MSISSGAVTTRTPSTISTGKLISGTAPPPAPDRNITGCSDKFDPFQTDHGGCVRLRADAGRGEAEAEGLFAPLADGQERRFVVPGGDGGALGEGDDAVAF